MCQVESREGHSAIVKKLGYRSGAMVSFPNDEEYVCVDGYVNLLLCHVMIGKNTVMEDECFGMGDRRCVVHVPSQITARLML